MTPRAPDAALRLAAIVESSDDAIVSKDLNGTITSWNHGAELLFGYTADEAIGRSITMLIPVDRLSEEDLVLQKIRSGERVEHFDTVRQRKDGTHVEVSVTVSPIRDPSGRIVGASKIARNISDRKRIEADLADLQHRLMALAMASASILGSPRLDAVLSAAVEVARDVFAADGYAVWRHESAEWRIVRSFGLSDEFAAEIIEASRGLPRDYAAALSEPFVCEDVDAAPAVADLRPVFAREGIRSLVVFPLLIDGERSGTIAFYSKRLRAYHAMDVQVGTAIANLTAAALTTAGLYEQQRLEREAADHARHQAAFLAEAGSVLSASLDYRETLKAVARLAVPTVADWCAVDMVSGNGVVTRIAVAHLVPEQLELARRLYEEYPEAPDSPGGVHQVIRTGAPAFMQRIPRDLVDASARDDEHRRILRALNLTSYMCVPLTTQGAAFGAITFVSAESGREYSEGDLRFALELAMRASLAVENARAYARANDANRLKDEFLATLSHELRTPLNAVLGYTRMLRLGMLGADQAKEALVVIERNAKALTQIIDDVLDVSRIVAGGLRLNVEPVSLPSILRDARSTVLPAAEAKGVRVDVVIDSLVSPVSGDPSRLQQIVWNLLSNAIKFTPRGGRVQLRLSRVNAHVEIAVTDTGRGIDPAFLPFVFERFRQGDAKFSREYGGLGLGLAIAKELAELHGGSITVSSGGTGQGATFTLRLPLVTVHQVPAAVTQSAQARADRLPPIVEEAPRLDGVRILAVDDESDSLNLLRAALEGAGAVVETSRSANAALEILRRQPPPDVLVADIGMPGMDGFEFIRAVRRMDEPARSIPAAALTAYARSQDRIAALASGFHMHLVKPIEPLELAVAIAALVRRR